MAADNTLNIAVQAETDPAQRSISALADDIENLGAKLGGKLAEDTQKAESELRALGQQEAAVQHLQRLGEQVNRAGQELVQLSHGLGRIRWRAGVNPCVRQCNVGVGICLPPAYVAGNGVYISIVCGVQRILKAFICGCRRNLPAMC